MKKFLFGIFLFLFSASASMALTCTGANYFDSASNVCFSCPGGYDYNTSSGKTNINQCQSRCTAGHYFVADTDYTMLEYIESTGTQWLCTDIHPTLTMESEIGVKMSAYTGDMIFGMYDTQYKVYRIFNYNGSVYVDIDNDGDNARLIVNNQFQNNTYYTFSFGNRFVRGLNNASVNKSGARITSFSWDPNNYYMCLFNSGHGETVARGKVYYIKMYDNDSLISDLVPVRRNSDNVVGMYDRVSGHFFTNSGTGAFNTGSDVGPLSGHCVDAGLGYYAPAATLNYGNLGSHTPCPAGRYSNITTAGSVDECSQCSGATYNDLLGATGCKSCPTGYTDTTTAGKNSISQCQSYCSAGHYFVEDSDYTVLTYIESTGTEYINTGYVYSDNRKAKVIIDTMFKEFSGWATHGLSGSAFGGPAVGVSNAQMLSMATDGDHQSDVVAQTNKRYLFTLDIPNKVFLVQDVGTGKDLVYTTGFTTTYNSTSRPTFSLFGYTRQSDVNPHKSRVYSAKLYNNGTLVRDFIPVRRNNDNTIGMYDMVTNSFFTNAGTGAFIAGSVVGPLSGHCVDAGLGHYASAATLNYGQTGSSTPCPAGRYSDTTTAGSVNDCPQCSGSSYNGTAGASSCTQCPTGYTDSTTLGHTQISQCQASCAAGEYFVTPQTYTQVDYIEGTGTQWLCTDIHPSLTLESEVKFNMSAYANHMIYGFYDGDYKNYRLFNYEGGAYFDFGDETGRLEVLNKFPRDRDMVFSLGNRFLVGYSPSNYSLYNSNITGSTFSSFPWNPNDYYMCIFNSGHGGNIARGKVYYIKMRENNTLVANLVPARRDSDNVLGMYDKITGAFFTNSGTGTFSAGSDVGTINGGGCVSAGLGHYSAAQTVNYGSTPTPRNACPTGTYSNTINASSLSDCARCPSDFYNDTTGASSCATCPSGYDKSAVTGKTSISQCETFCDNGNYVSQYTMLQYIESTGTQWFCTDIHPSLTMISEIGLKMSGYAGDMIYGFYNGDDTTYRLINANGNLYFDIGNDSSSNRLSVSSQFPNTKHMNFSLGNRFVLGINNSSVNVSGTAVTSLSWDPNDYYMCVFNSGHGEEVAKGQIFHLKIWDNDSMVADMVPARRNIDNVAGMYDKLTNKFYENQGTGTFVSGPVITGYNMVSCSVCPQDNYCPQGFYSYNNASVQGANQCPAGLYSPVGMWEYAQCGLKLNVDQDTLFLRNQVKTSPSLRIDMNNDGVPDYFANMVTQDVPLNSNTSRKLKIQVGNTTYSVCDDTVNVQ